MNISLDAGTNLTTIAYVWLGLKYLMPYLIGFILLGIAALVGTLFYNRIQGLDLSKDQILWGIIGAGLIAILFLAK